MSIPTVRCGQWVNLAASAAFSTGPCQIIGYYVNSTNAGTLIIKDGGTSGTALGGAMTPAIGYKDFPFTISRSGFATIGGTALDITLFITA